MSVRAFSLWVFGASATVVALMVSSIPLGIPGEWVWPRHPFSILALLSVCLPVFVYLLAVDRLAPAMADRSSTASGATLTVLGFLLTLCCLHAVDVADVAAGASRSPWVLYLQSTSGYYAEARQSDETAVTFLRGYLNEVRKGDHLHQGTHPPGLILLYRGLIAVVEAIPVMSSLTGSLSSVAWVESVGVLQETSAGPPDKLLSPVLWWASTLTTWAAAGAVWPLVALLRRVGGGETAWRLASLWPLVPGCVVFLPKSDCLFPVLGLTVALLWVKACERSTAAAFLAGLVACASLWLSLALGPVFAGIAAGSIVWAVREGTFRTLLRPTALGLVGFLTPIAGGVLLGINLPAVWRENLRNHAAFYEHFPRTYAAWLPVNLLEAAVVSSLPVVVAAITPRGRKKDGAKGVVAHVVFGVLASWGVLWLSGKNMGEAARLWVMLTPWPLLVGGLRGEIDRRRWWALAGAAAVAYAVVAVQVDGFNLGAAGS